MSGQIKEKIRSVDPARLQTVVSQANNDPQMRITGWTSEALNNQGVMNAEGLWRFQGTGTTGGGETRDWTLVLKYLTDIQDPDDPRTWWTQLRDGLVYEAGLLMQLPKWIQSPQCYAVWKHPDAWWIWMEYIAESTDPRWAMTEHAFAAYSLGCFHAELLSRPSLPDFLWLCSNHPLYWLAATDSWMDWSSSYVQRHIRSTYRTRHERLNEQRGRLLTALQRLPQVFSHWDMHRRNLRIRRSTEGQLELFAFDWTGAGFNAVGGDLANLVGGNLFLNEIQPEELPELEKVVLDAYLGSLRESLA